MGKLRDEHPLLFSRDPELAISEKTYSVHAINPFIRNLSSSRSLMMATHMSQTLPIKNGDIKLIQTGIEQQMVNSSFSIKVLHTCRVVAIVKNKISGDDNPSTIGIITVRDDIDGLKEFDIITIKPYEITSLGFGFMYDIDYDLIDNLFSGSVLEEGTILARTPTHGKDDQWRYGVNANLALISLPEVAEDGIVMSKSLANRLRYDYFEVKNIEFGETVMPLNTYGDDKTYKIIPDIMTTPNNQLVCVLRKIGALSAKNVEILDTDVIMSSRANMRRYDTEFDIGYYIGAPTVKNDPNSQPYVIDVDVYKNFSTNYSDMIDDDGSLGKYMDYKKRYYQQIKNIYDNEIVGRYRRDTIKTSPKLSEVLIDATYYLSDVRKVLQYKGKDTDAYHIDITTRIPGICNVGSKCSDLHGSKGIVIEVRDDEYMPYTIDKFGNKIIADIIMDPASVVSRNNPGRILEHFFNDASRKFRNYLRSLVKNYKKPTDNEIELCFSKILEFFALLETEQYQYYLASKDNPQLKREIVLECLTQEVYIYYKVSTEKRPIEIAKEIIEHSEFNPELLDVYFKDRLTGNTVKFKRKARIAPIYEILLNRRSDKLLATNIAKINHHGFPISTSTNTKNKLMWKNNPVRLLSETDTRVYNAYGSPELVMELKDRGLSQVTVREIYSNLLTYINPTNVQDLVDRIKVPYGEDAASHKLKNYLAAMGTKLTYTE